MSSCTGRKEPISCNLQTSSLIVSEVQCSNFVVVLQLVFVGAAFCRRVILTIFVWLASDFVPFSFTLRFAMVYAGKRGLAKLISAKTADVSNQPHQPEGRISFRGLGCQNWPMQKGTLTCCFENVEGNYKKNAQIWTETGLQLMPRSRLTLKLRLRPSLRRKPRLRQRPILRCRQILR